MLKKLSIQKYKLHISAAADSETSAKSQWSRNLIVKLYIKG
jgi:hypothetical protein